MKLKEISLNMHINKQLNFSLIIIHSSILAIYGHNGHFLVIFRAKNLKTFKKIFFFTICCEMH